MREFESVRVLELRERIRDSGFGSGYEFSGCELEGWRVRGFEFRFLWNEQTTRYTYTSALSFRRNLNTVLGAL